MRHTSTVVAELSLIASGTAIGAFSRWAASFLHSGPASTVAVNLAGAFILGFAVSHSPAPGRFNTFFWRKGVLAGFTTYSGIHLLTLGPLLSATAIASHIICGLLAAFLGMVLGKRLQNS